MESFYNILFEISNEERHKILLQLEKENMNVTQLSKQLGLSLTETSRHLSRILEVGLAYRDPDGLYHISNFGKVLLKQLTGLEFISKYTDYFNSHSLMDIPREFLTRIGELSNSYYVDNVMSSFHNIERMFKESEEYIFEITDRYVMSTYPLLRDAFKREVRLRNIQQEKFLSLPMYSDVDPVLKEELDSLFLRYWEERFLEELPFFLYMSEKEVACVGFRTTNGELDYIGFSSKKMEVHKWCRELFEHYWKVAKTKQNSP